MPPVKIKERARAKKGTMTRLLKALFKRYPVRLTVAAICIAFNALANLCSSAFVGLVTGVLTASLEQRLNPFDINNSFTAQVMGGSFTITSNATILLIMMGVVYGLGIFASWWWTRSMAIITQDFMNDFRKAMFNHMEDLPIKYFDTNSHGGIMSLYTNDVDTIRQFVSQSLPEMLRTFLSVVFSLVMMLINSIWMTLVVIFFAFMMVLNTRVIGGLSAKYFIKQQKQVAVVEGDIEESIKGLKVIKVFSHEEESTAQFGEKNELLRQYATSANIHGNVTMPINGNIGNFMYVCTAIVGCLILVVPGFNNLTLTGFHSINIADRESMSAFYSMILTFLMLCRMFSNNVSQFSQHVTFIVMGMAGASRCFALMDEQVEQDEGYVTLIHCKHDKDGNIIETNDRTREYAWKYVHKDGHLEYRDLKGDILLDKVDFSYDGKKLVLQDISIYAHPGQKIALVGATGAGKTTITNLINRFYPLADGKVRYDGININKIKKDDLRKSLAIVLQDVNLFRGTVMDNIRYGRLDATDEECIEAAKIANAHDFIERLPKGYQTELTGDGGNLSQGQRQLLSIARAAVADAPVLILDEATSSIDTRTERLVQDGMNKLMAGRTVFVIAHRLSTIQNSDAIMVMDHGRIIERGDHDSLIKEKGVYYKLYTGAFELE